MYHIFCMSLRYGNLDNGEYYHVFNRGVDKRVVFNNTFDYERMLLLMQLINSEKRIGSIFELSKGNLKKRMQDFESEEKLVKIYGLCLLPNHFHIVLQQISDDGISKFMQKLSSGYTQYFNKRNDRVGALFQGRYKYVLLDTEYQLLRMISYVNRNHEIHNYTGPSRASIGHHSFLKGSSNFIAVREALDLFGDVDFYKKYSKTIVEETFLMRGKEYME